MCVCVTPVGGGGLYIPKDPITCQDQLGDKPLVGTPMRLLKLGEPRSPVWGDGSQREASEGGAGTFEGYPSWGSRGPPFGGMAPSAGPPSVSAPVAPVCGVELRQAVTGDAGR